jgi:hypothetical protein
MSFSFGGKLTLNFFSFSLPKKNISLAEFESNEPSSTTIGPTVRPVARDENKKIKVSMLTSGNCIFHGNGKQSPLNQIVIIFGTPGELADIINIVQNFPAIGQCVSAWGGSKNRTFL